MAEATTPPPPTKFSLQVDSENKATQFKLFSLSDTHMRAFHLAWVSFFACFCSSFAFPPLIPIIRDNLNLTATDVGNAGIASVSGAVFARVVMGTVCDLFGPRLATSSLILLTAPAVFCSGLANSATGFLLARFFTGFSLATFVSSQFWMSSMFSTGVVATANGLAGGWGNLGGGAIQLIMPLIFSLIMDIGATKFTAWRIAFFIPALFQVLMAYAVFFLGQDLPDGNYKSLKKTGEKHEDSLVNVVYHAVTNYRGWILGLTYGYCFGVELTVDNIIANYFYDRFNVNLKTAGTIAATFGLCNLFSRPGGGKLSDFMGKKFGMRGRLWTLWIVQTGGGLLCILLGRVASLSASITVMIIFSIFVQAACGLTFGVVPFVSRRSLGVINGMTGGGGSVGAVLTQLIFFRGTRYSTQEGITLMGVMIVCCALPLLLIYFPQWGGSFCGPSPKGITEEDYYTSEWSAAEQEKGLHTASMKFADNSRRERGSKVVSLSTPSP